MHFKIAKKNPKKTPPPKKNFYDQVTYILMFVYFYGSQRYFIFTQNLPGATVIFENVKFSGRVYKVQNLQYTCTCNNLIIFTASKFKIHNISTIQDLRYFWCSFMINVS